MPNKSEKKFMGFYVDPSDFQKIKDAAQRERRTVSNYIRHIILSKGVYTDNPK